MAVGLCLAWTICARARNDPRRDSGIRNSRREGVQQMKTLSFVKAALGAARQFGSAASCPRLRPTPGNRALPDTGSHRGHRRRQHQRWREDQPRALLQLPPDYGHQPQRHARRRRPASSYQPDHPERLRYHGLREQQHLPHPPGDRSGKLTLRGLTITGGNAPGPGGDIFNLEGTLAQDHSRSPAGPHWSTPQRPVHHVGPLSRKSRAARGLGIRLGAPLWAIRNEVDPAIATDH